MINTLLLKSKFALKGVTQKELCEKMGIVNGSLSLKVNNKVAFTVPQIKQLKNLLDLTSEEVVEIFLVRREYEKRFSVL